MKKKKKKVGLAFFSVIKHTVAYLSVPFCLATDSVEGVALLINVADEDMEVGEDMETERCLSMEHLLIVAVMACCREVLATADWNLDLASCG